MDKQLVTIIIFLAVTFTLAGILVMGAVPKIFQTSQNLNQTQQIVNETQIATNETKNATEDQTYILIELVKKQEQNRERENNITHVILTKLNTALDNQKKQLDNQKTQMELLTKSHQGIEIQTEQNIIILNSLRNATEDIAYLTQQILNLTKQDTEGASEHRESTLTHHEKLIELGQRIDENIMANMTKKGITPN